MHAHACTYIHKYIHIGRVGADEIVAATSDKTTRYQFHAGWLQEKRGRRRRRRAADARGGGRGRGSGGENDR